jgi:hypothetical protein
MSEIDATRDLEALRQLKARYCRLLDAKDWAAWRALFIDDFVSDTTASGGKLVTGADDFVAFVRKNLGAPRRVTVHQVHAPELELLSEYAARGIWALEDVIRFAPGIGMRGYGHYHETYERVEGQWRFKTSRLTRLRLDLVIGFISVCVPGSVLARVGR